jgi:hypothetical protein
MEAGILPPVPEELHGIELQIEFVSTIAQAQKAVSVNSVDRLLGHVGMLTQLKGDSSPMDKIDLDKSIDRYADQLGVDPDLIVPGEKVALIRQQRAQAQQAAANAEQAAKVAGAAKDLGSVQTGSAPQENAASDIIGLFSGYNSPTTTEQAA